MNPIVVFDLETTGVKTDTDRIIQFAGAIFDLDTHKIIKEYNTYINPVSNYSIALGAYLKHGISPEFLKDKPTFAEVAPTIVEFFGDLPVLTYNGNHFDIPFLLNELERVGLHIDFLNRQVYDACVEERRRNGNTLEATYKRYKGKTMEEAGLTAHDASADIKATYAVFVGQQKKQPYGPEKMFDEDAMFIMQEFEGSLQPCFANGKYRGVSIDYISRVDQGYLKWCVEKASFRPVTKDFIKKYIK